MAPLIEELDYSSAADSDYAPPAAAADDADDIVSSSDSDSGAETNTPDTSRPRKKRKPARPDPKDSNEAEDAGFENSGDEAIIAKGRKRRRRVLQKNGETDAGDEDAGKGGRIKTRHMRAAEEEKRYGLTHGDATVDVDALWMQMISGTRPQPPSTSGDSPPAKKAPASSLSQDPASAKLKPAAAADASDGDPDAPIRIRRTYNFAGRVHTEEKLVPRSSAEAKLYLAGLGDDAAAAAAAAPAEETPAAERPPPRRAFRSGFEPVIVDVAAGRADLDLGVAGRVRAREFAAAARAEKARKLNTVEKSRLDWAGFVDKEGIKNELELAGRAKGSYARREEFLARSEEKREEGARRSRMATRTTAA